MILRQLMFILLTCSASVQASQSLAVNFPACDETWLSKAGLLERLRFELQPAGVGDVLVGPLSDEQVFVSSTLVLASTCDEQVELRLFTPPFKTVSRRIVSLAGLNSSERTRIISLVAAELFTVAPRNNAVLGVQEFEMKDIGIVVAKAEPENPCFGIGQVGLLVIPSSRAGLLSVAAGAGCKVSAVLQFEGALSGSFGAYTTDLGTVATQFIAAKTSLSAYSKMQNRWQMSLGLGLSLGWLHIEGTSKDSSVMASSSSSVGLVPVVVTAIEAPLMNSIKIKLGIEVGFVALGTEGRSQGFSSSVGGLSGVVLGVLPSVVF
jgi:hypothetical protein